jgi:RNA polymerase sigma-70 factor (ECF subfamily)
MDPDEWVARYGDYLYRHALARTGRQAVAEDIVQDTFVGAWHSARKFSGRGSERAWLLGILRRKIVDHYRQQQRELLVDDIEALSRFETEQFAGRRSSAGTWNSGCVPANWGDARDSLEQTEFWKTLHECLGRLPEKTARAFFLRELDGVDSPGICSELGIESSNLFVMLHRARLALRRCLELNWFKDRSQRRSSKP